MSLRFEALKRPFPTKEYVKFQHLKLSVKKIEQKPKIHTEKKTKPMIMFETSEYVGISSYNWPYSATFMVINEIKSEIRYE